MFASLLKGSSVSVSVDDVDSDGNVEVTVQARIGQAIALPPLTYEVGSGDAGGLIFGIVDAVVDLVRGAKAPKKARA